MNPTDKTESQVRKWALRKNGDDLTVRDVIELALAIDDDAVTRHAENVEAIAAASTEGSVQDERLDALEAWRGEQAALCASRLKAVVEEEFVKHPARRQDDKKNEDHRDERHFGNNVENEDMGQIRIVWRTARWWLAAAILFVTAGMAEWFVHRVFHIP